MAGNRSPCRAKILLLGDGEYSCLSILGVSTVLVREKNEMGRMGVATLVSISFLHWVLVSCLDHSTIR